MSRARIVLAGSLAGYPKGGGHWSAFLQYILGLKALGHDVFWFEILLSSGDEACDRQQVTDFFKRFLHFGFKDHCAVLLCQEESEETALDSTQIYGMSKSRIIDVAQDADVLWNFCCGLRQPFLSLFKRRVLIDLDPGLLQVCALKWNMGVQDHEVFLTVGGNLQRDDCLVPTLGVKWQSFTPFVYLPLWEAAPDPGEQSPFSSVTEWTWHTISLQERLLSCSKRDAYLRYIELPQKAGLPFELAANLHPDDQTGDRELLRTHGWNLVHPHQVACSPSSYRDYIKRSRAEIACAKPIYSELKTGWFSDRSSCYLASGRPVLAEDTGFSEHLPTGRGLLAFRNIEEAIAGADEIASNYALHRRGARELAEEFLDSQRQLESMLCACG